MHGGLKMGSEEMFWTLHFSVILGLEEKWRQFELEKLRREDWYLGLDVGK
jgi:hypothetical protein